MEVLIYLAKSAAILGLFYIVYWIALRRHTLFIANRQYLITGIIAALCLPLLEFTQTVYMPAPVLEPSAALELEAVPMITEFTAVTPATEPIDWFSVFAIVYGLGVLACAGRFIYHSWALRRVLKRGNFSKHRGYFHVETNQEIAPFSFFKYLVYNPELHSQEDLEMIIEHEKAHAKGWHSLDVLLGNLLTVVHWLNPMAWWYKKSMIQNLEFIADRQTIKEIPSKKAYQLALVKASTQGQHLVLSNSFYQSFIKNRIVMLNTNQSHKTKRWRLLLIVPLLALFMYSFNVNSVVEYTEAEKIETTATSPSFIFDKFSTAEDLLEIEKYFAENHADVLLEFSKEQWRDGKLVAFQLEVLFPESNTSGGKLIDENLENEVIPRVISYKEGPSIVIEHLDNREEYLVIDYNGLSYFNPELEAEMEKLKATLPSEETVTLTGAVAQTSDADQKTTTLVGTAENEPDYVFIINEKAWTMDEIPEGKKIVTEGHIELFEPEEGLEKFGQTGKDGVLVVHGKATFEDKEPETATTLQGTATRDITILITANMSKAQLDEKVLYLKNEHNIDLNIEKLEYNSENKISNIRVSFSNGESSGQYAVDNDGEAIEDIVISFDDEGGMRAGVRSNSARSEARIAARAAQMEARKLAMEARKDARVDALEARKAELALRREEMKAMQEARKLEMETAQAARKEELKAEIAALRAEQRAMVDRERALMAESKAALAAQLEEAEKSAAIALAQDEARVKVAAASYAQGMAMINKDNALVITKNTTDAELEEMKAKLAAEGVTFKYRKVKRNARGEITTIRFSVDDNKGSKSSANITGDDDEGIEDIFIEI